MNMNLTKRAYTVTLLIVGLGLAVSAYSQSFLTNGLIAYYPFNGNANDESGNTNNGSVLGATLTTDRLGETNSAFLFDGVASAITVLDSTPLRLSGTDYTICAWVFETQRNSDYQDCIISKRGSGNGDGWFLSIRGIRVSANSGTTGHVYYQLSGGADPIALSTSQLSLNVWHPVAVVYRSSVNSLQIFTDGNLDSTTSNFPSPNASTQAHLNIGSDSSGQNYYFHGKIDDIRIYNRALSLVEVQQLYAYESRPWVNLIKLVNAIQPSFSNLTLTTNYQLQVSPDMNTWTNQGSPFTATNTTMIYPQYWDVDNWISLFFRLQVSP
jgi:hypothetical protein